MTISEFKDSLNLKNPPDKISPLLKALWHDGKGDWQMAHNIAQDIHSSGGSWVHAYLHRKEGDEGNAGYWYSRANRSFPSESLEAEWEFIVTSLISAI